MMVLVTYDVNTETAAGRKRLRQVAKACEDYGQRAQKSVFECWVDASIWVKLRARLAGLIEEETDSLRFYFLGENWQRRVEHLGAKPIQDPSGPLIL